MEKEGCARTERLVRMQKQGKEREARKSEQRKQVKGMQREAKKSE